MKLHRYAILSSVFVCFSTTAPAFARTIVVDNDFADCPQAETNSIQEAVGRAFPGDKILVCPGIYLETVLVDHTKSDLRIEAQAAPGQVVLQAAAAQRFGFHLRDTTGVLVQGFTVDGFGDANIRIERGNGNTLRKNITTGATIASGIRVINSSANVVEQNTSSANLVGLTVQGAGSTDNMIRQNETFGNRAVGIQILRSGARNVLIGNRSHSNPIGIRNILRSDGNVIENNHVSASTTPASDGPPGLPPVFLSGGIIVGDSTFVEVRNNRIERNNGFGIRLQTGAADNVVEKNEVFQNIPVVTPEGPVFGDGIQLEACTLIPDLSPEPTCGHIVRNSVRLNTVRQNGRDGIRVDRAVPPFEVAGNTFERNVLLDNVEHDAHDDSVGPGTGGTANLWINNRCGRPAALQDENRPGLCEHRDD